MQIQNCLFVIAYVHIMIVFFLYFVLGYAGWHRYIEIQLIMDENRCICGVEIQSLKPLALQYT